MGVVEEEDAASLFSPIAQQNEGEKRRRKRRRLTPLSPLFAACLLCTRYNRSWEKGKGIFLPGCYK